MKKVIFVLILCLVGVGIFLGSRKPSPTPTNHDPIVLSALLPLTGNGSDQAEWIRQGLDLALQEINKDEKEIVISYDDTKGDTNVAISAYKKTTSQKQIPVVFTWGSGIGLALSPLTNEDRIVQMGVATASPKYTSPNDFTFRNFPSATEEAKYIANQIHAGLPYAKIALVKINNDYGLGQAEVFKNETGKLDGSITLEETLEPKTTDFRSIISKLHANPTDIIFLASYPTEGALFIKQLREQAITTPIMASNAILGGQDFFTSLGAQAEGLIISNSAPVFSSSADPIVKNFTQKYEEKYGTPPGPLQMYTARAYDAVKLVKLAMDKCTTLEPNCIQKELTAIRDYRGASGVISFDSNGDVNAQFNLQVFRDGKFVPYE